jgi:hypothetical protein
MCPSPLISQLALFPGRGPSPSSFQFDSSDPGETEGGDRRSNFLSSPKALNAASTGASSGGARCLNLPLLLPPIPLL